MTNLLLKTKTELFKWLRERERERERERRAQTQAENSENIFVPLFQFKVKFTELIVNNTPVFPSMWTCSFNIFVSMK